MSALPRERLERLVVRLSLAAVVSGVLWTWWLRLKADHLVYLIWADRDLMRAARPWAELPTSGAELSYSVGGRIPGGALYPLLKVAQQVHDDPVTVFRWLTLLDIAAAGLLFAMAHRLLGGVPALLAVALYASSPAMTDNLGRLWNPGFLPLFVAMGWWAWSRALDTRRARPLVALMTALAIAAQLHLSALLLLVILATGVVATRPPRLWRALAGGAAAITLTYVPYLVTEWRTGWDNTSKLLAGHQTTDGLAFVPAEVPRIAVAALDLLVGAPRLPVRMPEAEVLRAAVEVVRSVAWWPWALAVLTAPWLVRRAALPDGVRRVVDGATATIAVTLGLWAVEQRVALTAPGDSRYVFVLLPGVVTATAAALAALLRLLDARPGLRTAGLTLLSALLLGRLWFVAADVDRLSRLPVALPVLTQHLERLGQLTGRPLAEVIGSTVRLDRWGDGYAWAAHHGVDDLMRRQGTSMHGAAPPPCAILATDVAPDVARTFDVEAAIGQAIPGLQVLHAAVEGDTLYVVYDRSEGPCHTGFVNRYLPTPRELLLTPLVDALPPGQSELLDGVPDGLRAAVSLPAIQHEGRGGVPLVFGVDLVPEPGGRVEAELWGNQLRGHAFNNGFYGNGLIGAPSLHLEGVDGSVHTLTWPVDLVGAGGIAVPLATEGSLPPGRYRVALEVDLVPWSEAKAPGVRLDQLPRQRVSVPLPGTLDLE